MSIDFSKIDWEEVVRRERGCKYKSSECKHKPIKEIKEEIKGEHSLTVQCVDCGAWFWLPSIAIFRKLTEVQEFNES